MEQKAVKGEGMTIQDWGAIGEVTGALLVGVTLIFLAVQLRQTSRSVETLP